MRYLGGKSKIAKDLTKAITFNSNNRTTIWEPFIGGGSMTKHLSIYFNQVISLDSHQDLILMWKALQEGWVPPDNITEEQYNLAKDLPPSPLKGFIGFGCSFGGKWFGGMARGGNRDYGAESKRNVLDITKYLSNVRIEWSDYRNASPKSGDVVYCDPPYQGTTDYGTSFDHSEFWATMNTWHNNRAKVFVSEYTAPNDWEIVWETRRTRYIRGDLMTSQQVVERLYSKS